MTLMHQFYGAVLLQDDISMTTAAMVTGEEDHTPSILVRLHYTQHYSMLLAIYIPQQHTKTFPSPVLITSLQDKLDKETTPPPTRTHTHTQDSLYHFMGQRYQVPEVSSLATHDFLSSLSEHHLQHKVIHCVRTQRNDQYLIYHIVFPYMVLLRVSILI